ncbi:hypothetical protein MLD38_035424 [Melastoma candidum]|uniref:Uncharacterized protein n=1 Tax=Melastoma candidum TaxID=119954 RepID=A0ACB9LGU1_9MYRT|nr:hypothetical protein MLD38_035424 [Melastoma candidum]
MSPLKIKTSKVAEMLPLKIKTSKVAEMSLKRKTSKAAVVESVQISTGDRLDLEHSEDLGPPAAVDFGDAGERESPLLDLRMPGDGFATAGSSNVGRKRGPLLQAWERWGGGLLVRRRLLDRF